MVRDGARAPPYHEDFLPVNHGLALTMPGQVTNFMSFRGHLSRPACSHVKQLAKQAGDRLDPGRTYRSGRVFYGLISGGSKEPPEGSVSRWSKYSQYPRST